MATTIVRRSRSMMQAVTTPHPRSADTELLQRNISALAEHERNEQARKELALRQRRLARLQQISNLVDPNSMESFIKFAQERVDAALAKMHKQDAWEHMT